MKKLVLLISLILLAQTFAFADEIIDSKGVVTPCKVVTVCEGLVEYEKDGCLYFFKRDLNQPVFNDYIDVITNLSKPVTSVKRYSGNIIFRDFGGVRIKTIEGDTQIPWYKVKFVGIYNANINE